MDEDEAAGELDEGGAGGQEGDREEGGGDLLSCTGYTPKLCTSGQGKSMSGKIYKKGRPPAEFCPGKAN